jgi:hypothetical protein
MSDNVAGSPWFVSGFPWPWFRIGAKATISVGNPQHILPQASARFGFDIGTVGSVGGSNSSAAQSGDFPANVGSILNLSAAQIASAPAFTSRHNDQG